MKPKYLNRPLVAGCSIGHKSRPLHVSGWDMGQTKVHIKYIFPIDGNFRVVLIMLMYVQVLIFSDKFVFNLLFDDK